MYISPKTLLVIELHYSGRNFALLEFREMRDLEPKILRNSRNLQCIENTYDIFEPELRRADKGSQYFNYFFKKH